MLTRPTFVAIVSYSDSGICSIESACCKSCTVSTDQGSTNQVTKLEVTFRPAGGPALTLEDMETGAHAWSGLKVEPAVHSGTRGVH